MEEKITRMIDEVKKVIVGKDDIIQKVLMTVLAKGHILLEDIPGVGKTTLALAFSRALGLDYKRIQFTPDWIPSDVVGFSVYDKATGQLAYKPGAVMCNLLLADEITPDTCRLWDAETKKKLDKDRFRRDMGGIEEAYKEILHRITKK